MKLNYSNVLLSGNIIQWMPIEDYAAQPFVKETKEFDDVAQICLAKLDKDYAGFTPLGITTSSGKTSNLYFNNRNMANLKTSVNDQQ